MVFTSPNTSPFTVNTGASTGVVAATTQNYTLVSADLNNYLYFCVVPVASTGASPGTEVCSTASTQITGKDNGSITPPPTDGSGEEITYSTTATDSGGNPINASLTVTPASPAKASPIESILGPIKIESNSGGSNGYSIAVEFKLAADSTSTYIGFWKFGPKTHLGADEWYDYGTLVSHTSGPLKGTGYVISDEGKTLTVHLIDDKLGDDKLNGPDGKIVDPALLVVQAAAVVATSIPTLSFWGLFFMVALLSLVGRKRLRV